MTKCPILSVAGIIDLRLKKASAVKKNIRSCKKNSKEKNWAVRNHLQKNVWKFSTIKKNSFMPYKKLCYWNQCCDTEKSAKAERNCLPIP